MYIPKYNCSCNTRIVNDIYINYSFHSKKQIRKTTNLASNNAIFMPYINKNLLDKLPEKKSYI